VNLLKLLTAFLDQVVAAAPGDPGSGPLRLAGIHEVLLREADRVVELRSALAALESRTADLFRPEAIAAGLAADGFGPGWGWDGSPGVIRALRQPAEVGGPLVSIWFIGLPFRNLATPRPGFRRVLITAEGSGFEADGAGPAELAGFEPPAISALASPAQIPSYVRALLSTFRPAAEGLASGGTAGRGWWLAVLRSFPPATAIVPACEGALFEPVERLILDRMGAVETVLAEWSRLEDQLLPAALAPERFAEAFARSGTLRGYAFDDGPACRCAWSRAGVSVEVAGATLPALVGRDATSLRVVVNAPGRTLSDNAVTTLHELFRQAGREVAIDRHGASASWSVRPLQDERPLARLLAFPEQIAIEGVLVDAVVEILQPNWPG
jgi:hypothetical protein